MNKYFFILLLILLIFSCKTEGNNLEQLRIDNEKETRYYLMQMIESIETTRLLEQSMIRNLEYLDGTFWVKEIPETNLYSYNKCFAFFGKYILVFEVNIEDQIPELPITAVQRYKYFIYKITQCVEYEIIDNRYIKTLDGLISIFLDNTFLYIQIMGYGIEKYQLHSTFDTFDWNTVDIKPGDIVYPREVQK